jgi:hypothetical protein
VNSASQCIGKHCSLPREQIIVGKLLWDVFLTFLKFSLKFREQIPCREAASNALRTQMTFYEKKKEKKKVGDQRDFKRLLRASFLSFWEN